MDGLPDDLLSSILTLSRLPVKSLGRFKCVSTKWRDSISSDFDHMNRRREESKRNPKVIFVNMGDPGLVSNMTLQELDRNEHDKLLLNQFATFIDPTFVDVLRSKGEIVCILCQSGYFVCNPCTRDFFHFPYAAVPSFRNPLFAYIPSSFEYKLFVLSEAQNSDIRCAIFTISHGESMGSRSWRIVEENCPCKVEPSPGVFVNNFCYWEVWNEDVTFEPKSFVAFDIETETFGIIAGPHEGSGQEILLAEVCGSLCVTDYFTQYSTMKLWRLKSEGQEVLWENKYNLYVQGNELGYAIGAMPIYDRDGEIIIYDLNNSLQYYNIESKTSRIVENGMINMRISDGVENKRWRHGLTHSLKFGLYFHGFFSLVP